jgi:hypothetical protein
MALVDMQLIINEVEKVSKEVDINNPYSHPMAQVIHFLSICFAVEQRL